MLFFQHLGLGLGHLLLLSFVVSEEISLPNLSSLFVKQGYLQGHPLDTDLDKPASPTQVLTDDRQVLRRLYYTTDSPHQKKTGVSFPPRGELKRQWAKRTGCPEVSGWRGHTCYLRDVRVPGRGSQMWDSRKEKQPRDKEVSLCC